jgi:hypothetical protein
MLACTPENFRSEIARHRLTRDVIRDLTGMHPNELSMYVNGVRPLSAWAAQNVGWAINKTTGLMIFNVDMRLGPVEAPRGRPKSTVMPTRPRKKRWARREI